MNRRIASIGRPSRAPARRRWAAALVIATVAGCGPSDEVRELPGAAKESLLRKKADARPRPSPAKATRR